MKKFEPWKLLVVANLAASFSNVGAAWLAQLNWELWRYVGNEQFEAYHLAWWHGIWWAIFPVAGLSIIGVCLQLKWRPPGVPSVALWLALILQVLVYTGTTLWWGPGQARLTMIHLADGTLNPEYLILTNTNWIRTILFTLSGLLQGWIAIRSLG